MKLFAALFGARRLTLEQRAQREREARELEAAREREARERDRARAVAAREAAEAEAAHTAQDRRQRASAAFREQVKAARCLFPGESYGPLERDYFGAPRWRSWRQWRGDVVDGMGR